MGRKKASRKAPARRAPAREVEREEAESPRSTAGGKLIGAVHHAGRTYSPTKKGDDVAFAKLFGEEKGKISKATLQRLADAGVISGFGTKSKSKSRKQATEDGEDQYPDSATGGGVESVEEDEVEEDIDEVLGDEDEDEEE